MNIMELAKQARLRRHQEQAPGIDGVVGNWEELEAFAKLVAAHEREACAKICDDGYFAFIAADIIRERGET